MSYELVEYNQAITKDKPEPRNRGCMRRKRGAWMQMGVDDEILELLADSELTLSPQVIAYNIERDRSGVNKRCSELSKRGLLKKPRRGLYEITDEGRAYLAGDLDASELDG